MKILRKIFLLLLVPFIIAGVKIYYDLSRSDISRINEKSEIITFKNGKKIYIRAKKWGVAGNHEEIVFSELATPLTNSQYSMFKNFIFN